MLGDQRQRVRNAAASERTTAASARLIFGQADAEAEEPLEKQLLGLIRQSPGINRKGLHKALGGHVPAKSHVEALAKLRDRRRIRAEMMATGGRPGECWFPCDQPEDTHVSIISPDGDERTNKLHVGGASSFVRSLARDIRRATKKATQKVASGQRVDGQASRHLLPPTPGVAQQTDSTDAERDEGGEFRDDHSVAQDGFQTASDRVFHNKIIITIACQV